MNESSKKRVSEGITNLANMGLIPADEVQLNLDVLYDSILSDICSVIPMDSPRQIISAFCLVYGDSNKARLPYYDADGDDYTDTTIETMKTKDAQGYELLSAAGVLPIGDATYPSSVVRCEYIPNESGTFVAPYHAIIPGTIKFEGTSIIDDRDGNIIDSETNSTLGTVDYRLGVITFNGGTTPSNLILSYNFDIYDLENKRNTAKFEKRSFEVFADIYSLDIDAALPLFGIKALNLKETIENIVPQVLTHQIDQFVLDRYFDWAKQNIVGTWSNELASDISGVANTPAVYGEFDRYISTKTGEFARRCGVAPNIMLCTPYGFGVISASYKFIPAGDIKLTIGNKEKDYNNVGTLPCLMGYFNNYAVYMCSTVGGPGDVNIVLTYKGESDAQSAGAYSPYIPVALRTADGMEGGGMIRTYNAYSIGGFTMINPKLVAGVIME